MSWRPLQFLIAMCAGSLQRRQQTLVAYLIEENLVLRKKLGPKRLRFTDAERRQAAQVRQMLEDSGVKPVRLPPRSPNLNAYAERFVRTIRTECLSRFVLFSEGQLRHLCRSFAEHYHTERNHQGIGNVLIVPPERWGTGAIKKKERLGGTLQYYYREAA